MDLAWYLFHAPGHKGLTRLSAERASELRALGHRLDPAEPPPDLSHRLGDLLAGLCRPSRHLQGVQRWI